MTKRIFLLAVLSILFVSNISAKKPNLVGTKWEYNNEIMLHDVGMTGSKETFVFISRNEVKITHVKWEIYEKDLPVVTNLETGEVIPPPRWSREATRPVTVTFTCSYKVKKVKVNGRKFWRLYITKGEETEEYAIDHGLLIPSTTSLADRRIFKQLTED